MGIPHMRYHVAFIFNGTKNDELIAIEARSKLDAIHRACNGRIMGGTEEGLREINVSTPGELYLIGPQ
jgi:hypothetical protein